MTKRRLSSICPCAGPLRPGDRHRTENQHLWGWGGPHRPYDPTLDLIFLDIQMGIMDGLRTAQRIREMDGQVSIIFLTTLAQYSLEGYQYQATNYILKPLQYIRLKAEMTSSWPGGRRSPTPSW